jgi:polar amino acid transport system substrate-binding protein
MTASSTPRTTAARSRLAAAGAIAVAGALLLTGCGDQTKNDTKGSGSASTASAPLAGKLPKEIRDKGRIEVGSDIAYAPVEFKDSSGKAVGLDPDLAAAMGKQLGVKLEFQNGTFDALLTGLRSGRYDTAMSAMTARSSPSSPSATTSSRIPGCARAAWTRPPPTSRSPRTR